ncbi:MAG TPA: hypothetical protein VIT45_12355 [Allosphingosinicella sp.]
MPDRKQREARRAQQTREIEENQEALRRSIAESQRLIERAVEITGRHHRELAEDEETLSGPGSSPDDSGVAAYRQSGAADPMQAGRKPHL